MSAFRFPFGQLLGKVEQEDTSAKRVFVLGVYASAVHARWIDANGRLVVRALAVASEPEIFWRGVGVQDILDRIDVPAHLGALAPADARHNGPSGVALDELYLTPLGLSRSDAWLCDLLPESRMNAAQGRAIEQHYAPLAERGHVPPATVPVVPTRFADDARRVAILKEVRASSADTLITLGDVPLRDFVRPIAGRHSRLANFGTTPEVYGRLHEVDLGGLHLRLLPLVHPRQASRLGLSTDSWAKLHAGWVQREAEKHA